MTVLTAAQAAGIRIKSEAPDSLFSSPTTFATEVLSLLNESATAIAKSHDWRKLFKTHTVTGDGSDTDFALPSDYDRMPIKAEVYDTGTSWPMTPLSDPDEYLRLQIENFSSMTPGYWIIEGGNMNIYPALANTATAKFKYIRNTIFTGGTKTACTADADTFDLPERLLTLGIIWRWKQMKGREYAEDMQNYEIALSEERNRDKGSRIIKVGRATVPTNATYAYPRALG